MEPNSPNQQIEFKAKKLLHSLDEKPVEIRSSSPSGKTVLIIVLLILAGVVSGYGIAKFRRGGNIISGQGLKSTQEAAQSGIKVGDIVGVQDESTFKDSAEGVLTEGGVSGEGSHHLLREGGLSQNVYLTSSIVDLNLFTGHKIKVFGETFAAQKAGWLMDVGRVKVLELNSAPPFEEE